MKAKKKMSMYKKGGFNPLPDTSYQSPASKSARAKSANKAKQIKEANEQAVRGDMKAQQAARFAIEEFGKGDRAGRGGKMDELYDKMMKRKAVAERAKKKSKALSNKDLSEFKEYKGGGKMYGKKGMKVKKYAKGGPIVPDNKGKTAEDQAMAIVKQKGAERRAALQPFYDLESEVNAARKTYDEHVERLKVLNKGGRSYNRMLQTLRKDREAIANLLKDDRMNIEGVSGVEKSNLMRMMPK